MKYTPAPISEKDNPNRPQGSEMVSFVKHCLAFALAAFLFIWFFRFMVILALPWLPFETEASLGRLMRRALGPIPPISQELQPFQDYLQELTDRAVAARRMAGGPYRVSILEDETENAVVLPGGEMLFYTKILSGISSENELMMIIGHELGHCYNRDHLKALGPAGATLGLFMLFSGTGSGNVSLISKFTNFAGDAFSRAQEQQADEFGLNTLYAIYGHGLGATDFFSRMKKVRDWDLTNLFGTHPSFDSRIAFLEQKILEKDQIPAKRSVSSRIESASGKDRDATAVPPLPERTPLRVPFPAKKKSTALNMEKK